jgi:hypothetical protein
MNESNQKIMVASVLVLVVIAIVFSLMVLQKLERITQVAERTDLRVEKIAKAAAPVGAAAVGKSIDVIQKINTEEMSNATSEGIKEIGTAAKDRFLKSIEKKKEGKK